MDFSALVAQSGERFPSVISLRLSNPQPEIVFQILQSIIPEIENVIKAGAIVSVDEKEYRIRKLPID